MSKTTNKIQYQNIGVQYGKYRNLLVLIASFLGLVALLSIISFVSATRFSQATRELELVSQQSATIQQLSRNLIDINLYLEESLKNNPSVDGVVLTENLPQQALYRIEEVNKLQKSFNQTLTALRDGGVVHTADGGEIELDAIKDGKLKAIVTEMEVIWTPYLGLLNNFIADTERKSIKKTTSDYLVDYTRLYNQKLQNEVVNISAGLGQNAQNQAGVLQYVQVVGIIIAIGLFFAMVFGALRQLASNDKLLELARRETTEIMTTVNTGLFLLDKDLNIGNQYSNALENIIGTKRLAGENLNTVLRSRISDKDLETTRQFVEQLYNPRVKENLINDLNPLNKIMFRDEQSSKNRYLDFKFSRVYEGKDIIRILVNVNDVSESVLLEQRLEKERAQNDLQIEMLTTILNVHPQVIKEFINNTLVRINKINDVLKNPGSSQFELETKLKSIYREMHSLKGEASALKLHNFTKIASESEDKMQALQNKGQLVGNDFLPLAVHLDELLTLANTIAKLGERINSGGGDVATQPTSTVSSLLNSHNDVPHASTYGDFYKSFAKDIANRQNKEVHIDVDESQFTKVPAHLANIVKEMSIQLLRNAIVHGIEDTESRIASGKNALGLINMSILKEGQNLVLTVKDDGKGIDYTAIRLQLVAKGLYTAEQARDLTEAQLLQQLFTSGFSTKNDVDEDGGRGVGLDIIKERLTEFKGQIDVKSKLNQGTQFVITLPL